VDECHITYDRASKLIEKKGSLDKKSKEHILSHCQTKDVSFSNEREVIQISVVINSVLVDSFMQDFIDKLRKEISPALFVENNNSPTPNAKIKGPLKKNIRTYNLNIPTNRNIAQFSVPLVLGIIITIVNQRGIDVLL